MARASVDNRNINNRIDYFEIGALSEAQYSTATATAIARSEELGATVALPLVDNGNIQFAHLIDPTRNRFAVWRQNPTE